MYILRLQIEGAAETFETNYAGADFTISPNPTDNLCTITSHTSEWMNYRLNIYSADGKLLRSLEKNDEFSVKNIRVSDLPKGALIFQLDNENQQISRTVIKL